MEAFNAKTVKRIRIYSMQTNMVLSFLSAIAYTDFSYG